MLEFITRLYSFGRTESNHPNDKSLVECGHVATELLHSETGISREVILSETSRIQLRSRCSNEAPFMSALPAHCSSGGCFCRLMANSCHSAIGQS